MLLPITYYMDPLFALAFLTLLILRYVNGFDSLRHGANILQVSINEAEKIYRTARHPKSFISLDTADHLLTRPGDKGTRFRRRGYRRPLCL